jgi:dihydroorotate dehydrogenase
MNETIRIGHLEVESPFANAGGVIKHVEDVEAIARTGVGWIEAGSYTLEPRVGNSPNGETVYVHDPETGSTWNSLGMPNKVMDVVEKEIPEMAAIAHKHNKPLIVNVAPVSDNPLIESIELVTRAYEAGADAVLLNGGCPNVVTPNGGRHEILSHDREVLRLTLSALAKVTDKYNKIFLRTSPLATAEQADHIASSINKSGVVSAVFTPNTWPGNKPPEHLDQLEVPGGVGGLSGPTTQKQAWDQAFGMSLRGTYDVVCSGGITTGEDLYKSIGRRVMSSNIVAGAGTTFFYQSGDWRHDVDKLIHSFIALSEDDKEAAPQE